MSDRVALSVNRVSKSFKLPHEKYSGLKQTLLNFRLSKSYEIQHVLNDVSFDIKEGEFFGIVGRNGSGKSTLLKLLAQIYVPNKGSVSVHGSLTPFIELGVGFNPELTGRENIYLNGALLGFNRKHMDTIYDSIVEFAELEEFMDQKLKNYSSGMQVRLAFSIAIQAKSQILLIDEVLAVGDENFQKKCIEVFEDLKRQGRTIIFVSHSMAYVREFCDRVAVIDAGNLVFVGDTEKSIDIYKKLNFETESTRAEIENEKHEELERFGNGMAQVTSYELKNQKGEKTIKLRSGEKFSAELEVEFYDFVKNPAVGIMFRKHPQENLLGINNFYSKQNFGSKNKGDVLKVTAKGTMPLAPGAYSVSFSVSDAQSEISYSELDILNNAMKVNIDGEVCWGLIVSDIVMEAQ